MKLYAKKSLGQHFLNSKHVLEQIIAAAEIKKSEKILEIGPGTGTLTEALLETGANVVAIEKDHRAIDLLRIKFEVASGSGQLRVIEGDILDTELLERKSFHHSIFQSFNSPYSVVANIPYYITGAILEKFLAHEPRPDRMILLVQKEVAERIVEINNGKESILSISVKAFGTPRIITKVPRGAFTPAPTVDSAILAITNISNDRFVENNIDISRFFEIVRAGFAHKRKFLMRNLEEVVGRDKVVIVWQKLKLDPQVRAEDISVDQWFLIAGM